MRIAFYTLGCKLNQCETEALASSWRSQGFFVAPWHEDAEIYIFNTCTVTSKSEQKARRVIRRTYADHPGGIVIITGCYAEVEQEYLQKMFPRAVIVPRSAEEKLLSLPEYLLDHAYGEDPAAVIKRYIAAPLENSGSKGLFDFSADEYSFHTRPFLKIQDGCSNSCTYCRVTIARGPSVSLELSAAVERAVSLEERGFQETVLTGVNISAYASGGKRLADLINALTASTDHIRFRLSSLEPNMITRRLLEAVRNPRVRPHFHLPVQSGSDRILAVMNRNYRADMVYKAVESLRDAKFDPFIAADIIVGFPGETDDDFRRTAELLENLKLSQLHVFPFSRRPGTAAYSMKPHVPERIVKERTGVLHTLSEAQLNRYSRRWDGKTVEVLVESEARQTGPAAALSENYLRIEIMNPYAGNLKRGQLLQAALKVTEEEPIRIIGVPRQEQPGN